MNHKERVLTAIRHRVPDKVPRGDLAIESRLVKALIGNEKFDGMSPFERELEAHLVLGADLINVHEYPFRLARASGKQWMPASNLDDGQNSPIRFHGVKARYVRLKPDPTIGVGDWGGKRFGLSEVRFTYEKP